MELWGLVVQLQALEMLDYQSLDLSRDVFVRLDYLRRLLLHLTLWMEQSLRYEQQFLEAVVR